MTRPTEYELIIDGNTRRYENASEAGRAFDQNLGMCAISFGLAYPHGEEPYQITPSEQAVIIEFAASWHDMPPVST